MSCYICTSPRTYNCIMDVLVQENELNALSANEILKRLYALNVRSYCERYDIKKGTPEYAEEVGDPIDLNYEPLGDKYTLAEKLLAVDCWLYQSCEGSCDKDPDFIMVGEAANHQYQLAAAKITGRHPLEITPREARSILRPMQEKNNLWE